MPEFHEVRNSEGKRLEKQKFAFTKKLRGIFNAPIVTNLDQHFLRMVGRLGDLLDEMVAGYEKTSSKSSKDKSRAAMQDEACEFYLGKARGKGISKVDELIEHISNELMPDVRKAQEFKRHHSEVSTAVFIPPDTDEAPFSKEIADLGEDEEEKTGGGRANIYPRVEFLLFFLLRNGVTLTKEENSIVVGTVGANMVRTEPYQLIPLPQLNRFILECDQERNSLYIFDSKQLEELRINKETLVNMSKAQLNSLIYKIQSEKQVVVGRKISHIGDWLETVRQVIFGPLTGDRHAGPALSGIDVLDLQLTPLAQEGEWKGFSTDRFGRHWGVAQHCGDKMSVAPIRFYTSRHPRIVDSFPQGVTSQATRGMYCYELLSAEFGSDNQRTPNGTGEWTNFHVEGELHYGSQADLLRKIETKYDREFSAAFILRLTKGNEASLRFLEDFLILVGGKYRRVKKMYCYEDFEAAVVKRLSREILQKDDKQREYCVKDGQTFRPIGAVAAILLDEDKGLYSKLKDRTIRELLRYKDVPFIETLNGDNQIVNSYDEVELKALIRRYMSLPEQPNEGLILHDGEEYGFAEQIYDKVIREHGRIVSKSPKQTGKGIVQESFKAYLEERRATLRRIPARRARGAWENLFAYNYTDVLNLLKEEGRISSQKTE